MVPSIKEAMVTEVISHHDGCIWSCVSACSILHVVFFLHRTFRAQFLPTSMRLSEFDVNRVAGSLRRDFGDHISCCRIVLMGYVAVRGICVRAAKPKFFPNEKKKVGFRLTRYSFIRSC